MIVLYIGLAVVIVLALVAVIKKPGALYKNYPDEQNPMEGKKVRFVAVETEPVNADGVCEHCRSDEIDSREVQKTYSVSGYQIYFGLL